MVYFCLGLGLATLSANNLCIIGSVHRSKTETKIFASFKLYSAFTAGLIQQSTSSLGTQGHQLQFLSLLLMGNEHEHCVRLYLHSRVLNKRLRHVPTGKLSV